MDAIHTLVVKKYIARVRVIKNLSPSKKVLISIGKIIKKTRSTQIDRPFAESHS